MESMCSYFDDYKLGVSLTVPHRSVWCIELECLFIPLYIQWKPSIADTIWNQHFVPYSKVSLTQGL